MNKLVNIQVVPYCPTWPQAFEQEARKIKQALGEVCVSLHHIGSTAVPGLSAKPKIDMIMEALNPKACIARLESLGYEYRGEWNIPFKFGFRKRGNLDFNLHVFEPGHAEVECNLVFRDYLQTHPESVQAYAELKQGILARQSTFEKINTHFTRYNLDKDDFIRSILDKAGFNRIRMHYAVHDDELEKAKLFRQKTFFDPQNMQDPYLWTFDHPEHIHLILHQGVEVVGYAHLQKWAEQRVVMRMMVIAEPFRGKGLGAEFLRLCEKWCQAKGKSVLQVQSTMQALAFYRKQGYIEMSFNVSDGYENNLKDIDLGKRL